MTSNGFLARLAAFCHRRRRLVLLLWIATAAGILVLGFTKGAPTANQFSGKDAPSARAQELLAEHFPGVFDGDQLTLAVHANSGVDTVKPQIDGLLGTLRGRAHVSTVDELRMSADGRTAFATIRLDVKADDMPVAETKRIIDDVRAAGTPELEAAIGGSAVDKAETPAGGSSEGIGLLAAAIVLLVAFGSLLAMALPIVTAVFGIGTGLAGAMLLNHLLPAPSFAPILAAMIGLGVGVDYALFIVTRYRDELHAGQTPEQATVSATASAGRAVLFAGTTVVIGLLGLMLMDLDFIRGVAIGAALTVLCTMVAAVTLLPALLGFSGRGIDRLRVPGFGRGRTGKPLAARWAGVVQRHPVVATVGATVVLVLLALPVLGIRLSMPDASTQPPDTSAYTAHRILADGFGAGYDAPLVIVSQPASAADPVAGALRSTPGIASVGPARTSPDGAVAVLVAYPTTDAQSAQTADLVRKLRADVLPAAAPGAGVYVGGTAAGSVDFAAIVADRLPMLIIVVVGLSVLLLIAVFRSVVLAIKAAVVNLLSIGAAYGFLVATVQWGWLAGVFGFSSAMPIAAFVPFIMFPILFGLSMDYEVFLVSRIREAYDKSGDARRSVADGLTSSARVITAAAAIMIAVFLSFVAGSDVAIKQLGLGMAVMVLIDATVVRMLLVPAAMELFGKANWWMPRWLDRVLPRIEVEAALTVA
jgi:uncharacterized membrane protein YdfJ with MMPL/SSD domain